MNYSKLIQDWEEGLRQGQARSIRQKISKLNTAKVPRAFRQPLANIARRLGSYEVSLRMITPNVLDIDSNIIPLVKHRDLAEYAVSLQRIGLSNEAFKKLSLVDESQLPEALLYKSFCYFNWWDYSSPKELLNRYIHHENISHYQKLIGKVNLLSCYVVNNEMDLALDFGEALREECQTYAYVRLYANCLELLAQVYIQKKDFSKAKDYLTQSYQALSPDGSLSFFFIEKWKAFIEANEKNSLAPLQEFEKKAILKREWESFREADFLMLKIKFNDEVFRKILYGSYPEKYRERVLKEFGISETMPEQIVLEKSYEKVLDPYLGIFNDKEFINKGKKAHQLLNCLFFDLYKPMRVGNLFSTLYSDENFNIYSSPLKIRQLMLRLRRIIKDQEIPIKIIERKGEYRIERAPQLGLVLQLNKKLPSLKGLTLESIEKKFIGHDFTIYEVMEGLNISLSKTTRIINEQIKNGKVIKIGAGPKTKYKIASENKKAS